MLGSTPESILAGFSAHPPIVDFHSNIIMAHKAFVIGLPLGVNFPCPTVFNTGNPDKP